MMFKHKDVFEWHAWFAWYPVIIYEEKRWVWWEWIERKVSADAGSFTTDYRFPTTIVFQDHDHDW